MKAGRKDTRARSARRSPDVTAKAVRQRSGRREPRSDARRDARRPNEPGATRRAPRTAPVARPSDKPTRAKTATQAKARAKARKAKAPKVIRPPLRERLRERLITRLAGVDLRPQSLLARIPFVVLVIGSLGIGLAITLWLSTDSAGRSYQLGSQRALNDALSQQKEALERDVLQAESAPALAEAARNLGMIPSKDTAHLVQDPGGNWVVVGKPKPAEGVPPPPLNSKLPDPKPPEPPAPAPRPLAAVGAEVPVRVIPPGQPGLPVAPGAATPMGGLPAPTAPAVPPASPPAANPVPPGLSLPVVEIPAAPMVPVAPANGVGQ